MVYLDQYIAEKGIEDMSKETQSKWNACLMYIYNNLFKADDTCVKYNNKNACIDYSDYETIDRICNIYINLCFEYDKEISVMGFSLMTGISRDTIYSWGNGEYRLNSSHSDVYKKLHDFNEESLSNMLVSGKKNPVGILGCLNRRHGWNMPGAAKAEEPKRTQSIDDIARRYGITDTTSNADADTEPLEPPVADF
ncbi:MAG: hypothetical protein LIP12_00805 [Clostridiales bacterium]|nr:hypothetical protein [Clostridiales bacterium]